MAKSRKYILKCVSEEHYAFAFIRKGFIFDTILETRTILTKNDYYDWVESIITRRLNSGDYINLEIWGK